MPTDARGAMPIVESCPSSRIWSAHAIARRLDLDRALASLAVAHDVGHTLADDPPEQRILGWLEALLGSFDEDVEAGCHQRDARPAELGLEVHLPVAGDSLPDIAQRGAHDLLDVGQLLGRARRVAVDQPAGKLGLERDQGQAVTEQVVEVTGDPRSLDLRGGAGNLRLRGLQLPSRALELAEAKDNEACERHLERRFEDAHRLLGAKNPTAGPRG